MSQFWQRYLSFSSYLLSHSQPLLNRFQQEEIIIYSSVKTFLNLPYFGQSFNQYLFGLLISQVSYTVLDYHYAFHLRCFFKFLKASRETFLTILVYALGSYVCYTLPYNPNFYHIQCTYSRIHKDPVLPYNHCIK